MEGNKRYLEKLDHITIRVQGGTKEKIKARAQQKGMSLNAYIVYLIEKDMKTEEDT
nr:toxin-antitoxin system HicB family antitoxin [Flavonifractor plautii]